MTGLSLSEQYYREIGRPALEQRFPELLPRIAAGFVGEGSECFGYDDEVSRDHDFGPGFCLWLREEDYARYGEELKTLYESLPGEFAGFPARSAGSRAGKRLGVHSIPGFYSYFLGGEVFREFAARLQEDPASAGKLLSRIPEERLATCTNGRIFEDNAGLFTGIREAILGYYPVEMRIAKIASEVFRMAQSGQYNYARCMRHGEYTAAELSKFQFAESALHLMFLLGRRYEPYYKWSRRMAGELPLLRGVPVLLDTLMMLGPQQQAWRVYDDPYVNRKDEKVRVIEEICALFLKELRAQGLTDREDAFLEPHVEEIYAHIGR